MSQNLGITAIYLKGRISIGDNYKNYKFVRSF